MDETWPYPQDPYTKLVVIGGAALLGAVFVTIFLMIIFGMRRNANIHRVKKWFWTQERPNGKHVENGNTDRKH